jgi:hypothetical protein
MPSTKGLEMFLRKESLNEQEWLGLIEARRDLIKPLLNSFTLRELGALECLRSELNFTHALKQDAPEVVSDAYSLKTQGFFQVQPWSAIKRFRDTGFQPGPAGVACPDGEMLVWGLTRDAEWVLAKIVFQGEAGYKDRGLERANRVEITSVDILTLAQRTGVSLERIWTTLGEEFEKWLEHRLSSYNELKATARIIKMEQSAWDMLKHYLNKPGFSDDLPI